MITRIYPKDGLRSTSGRLLPKDGLKGQQANSPGQRPGYSRHIVFALKGQKLITLVWLLPFQGVAAAHRLTQGVALGYELLAFQAALAKVSKFSLSD